MKFLSFFLLSFLIFVEASKASFNPQKDSISSLSKRANDLLSRSKRYSYTTVVNIVDLENLIRDYNYSLNEATSLLKKNKIIAKESLSQLSKLKKTNSSLSKELIEIKNSKFYNLLIFQILALVFFLSSSVLGFHFLKFRSISDETVHKNQILQEEIESIQKTSIKRQQELNRKLQDEILKNREINKQDK